MDRCLQSGKLCLCFLKVLSLDRQCQITLLLDPLSALSDLILNDLVVDPAEFVKFIILIL